MARNPVRLTWTEQAQLTHTEGKMTTAIKKGVRTGDVLTIEGEYDPCGSCRSLMVQYAKKHTFTIDYINMTTGEEFSTLGFGDWD